MLVAQVSRGSEVHLFGDLACGEENLATDQPPLEYAVAAQLYEALAAEGGIMVEEGRAGDVGAVQLLVQQGHQVRWQKLQRLDLLLVRPRHLAEVVLLQEAPDGPAQTAGHLVLAQVRPEHELLLPDLGGVLPQLRYGGRDGAQQRRERDKREEQAHNGVDPLGEIERTDLHAGGRELRQRPVEAGEVGVRDRRILYPVRRYPVWHVEGPTDVSDQKPPTRQVVVDAKDERHRQRDVEDRPNVLGVDQLEAFAQHPLQLHEPQQPDRPQNARHASGLPNPEEPEHVRAPSSDDRQIDYGPVNADEHEVKAEPRLDVVPGNLVGPHLNQAFGMIASHKRPWYIDSPKHGGGPIHHVGEGAGPAFHDCIRGLDKGDRHQGN
mmetsp:Transcript_56688/g.151819  ORF Transcript_56688/g.151819 Transcript_56688/m.151819 type:complete len:379 (-) Transcript_56688:73-1209(-)